MQESQCIITCHIEGITSNPHPSMSLESFSRIEKAGLAVNQLLSAFGAYGIDDTPKFRDRGLVLTVVTTCPNALPFDAKLFDLFVRNIAEYIDARHDGRSPLLTHADHGLAIDDIEQICESLSAYGTILLQVDAMDMIELRCRRRRKGRDHGHYATMELESTTDVTGLKHSRGELIVSSETARTFRPGDLMPPISADASRPLRRAVASMIRIIDGSESVTMDMFGPDEGSD
jgi:hypothetical protein